ncbi:VWA domain-containing protein [Paraburkholderia humisilvae]|uniref:VWA domain-containing protein n=1 Tax=Paraburkholderia humisilvae TaxID=627669 RepID=UPI001FE41F45|nr:VWA domain-containing protein [Paraburkholderia humisilvae]
MKTTSKKRQQGAVSIVVVASLAMLLAGLGLALDAGLGYMVKAKLDAAADGAAIAAGQAVTRGNTPAQQMTNAQQAATAFFAANYPSGFLNSTATLQTPSVTFNNGTVTIDIAAQAKVPTTFTQLIGYRSLSVATSSESIRRDLDMAFVIDTTSSMSDSTTQKAVRTSSVNFLNNFDVTNDRVALMHFATGTVVDVPFKAANARGFDRTTMTNLINGYSFNGNTNSEEAVWNARWQLNHVITQPSSLRVIVFFSDGAPNSFSSAFPMTKTCTTNTGTIVSSDDPPTGSNQTDNPGGLYQMGVQTSQAMSGNCYSKTAATVDHLPANYNAHAASEPTVTFPIVTNTPRVVTQNMNGASYTVRYQNINRASRNLLEAMAAQARSEGIYVFALGYGPYLTVGKGPDGELGSDILKCIANVANGPSRCYNPKQPVGVYCYAATPADLQPCYSQLASQILRISK